MTTFVAASLYYPAEFGTPLLETLARVMDRNNEIFTAGTCYPAQQTASLENLVAEDFNIL